MTHALRTALIALAILLPLSSFAEEGAAKKIEEVVGQGVTVNLRNPSYEGGVLTTHEGGCH